MSSAAVTFWRIAAARPLNHFQQQSTGADHGALFAGVSISILPMTGLCARPGRRR
ncbi:MULTISPECIES: hypothetical protein [Kitasatospora]|uniref:hypothetical protein n=1 Tax=Kitasatospora TaxID=2063 RepID=UPI000AB6F688|nr:MULTISPECIES: hypothetical protein [Kitasatospora]